ncbi:hypothetical protein KP79_PYT20610 [Mizuhopecten yessoensis]|uniref:SGNH hydrolase-type esterase domain-containing protein n=1 Tax=Mizuhopecten yessoensis TaxID=6573 RepID=A0A210QKD0_MIZYE|nr:hypothetical protein KP79_PYT20610 [Mizuhopecten yessoensis]
MSDNVKAPRRKVLVLGHSFITRLSRYANELPSRANLGLHHDVVEYHGFPGAGINRIYREFSRRFRGSGFDVVCLQCGGNDLSCPSADPDTVVQEICTFVDWLVQSCGVQTVAVCKLFFRASTQAHKGDVSVHVYNERVSRVNTFLAQRLCCPQTIFWDHRRSIWDVFSLLNADGVHLRDQKPYYRSIKSCVLFALGS